MKKPKSYINNGYAGYSIYFLGGCDNTKTDEDLGFRLAIPDDTNLEFWITEGASYDDFSEYQQILGWMGGSEFYGKINI